MKDRIVFYSKYDMSIGWQYKRIAELVQDAKNWPDYEDIEDVIELYQLMLVIDTGVYPDTLTENEWKAYQNAAKGVKKIVAKRFIQVNDDTIEKELESINISYKEPFWDILIAFGGIDRISSTTVERLLNTGKANILHLLMNKKAVMAYGQVIKTFLQSNVCYARELVTEYLEKREANYTPYFFPEEMTREERISIINQYIDSPEASANDLKLLSVSQGNDLLPISPKMRLKAKEKYNQKMEQLSKTGVTLSYGVGITFKKQKDPVLVSQEGECFSISYDSDWIIENLDYPSLFNNFIYLFGFVDGQYRWQHISKKSMIGVFERTMGSKGKREYIVGSRFKTIQMLSTGQMQGYMSLLEEKGIYLEDMIKWFFESYLPKEFDAKGFIYNASTKNSTWLEKCRNIAIENDSILKQYRLFCEDGVVNRELFEISTEHMLISNVPTQIKDKYVYLFEENAAGIVQLLFSDQSLMLFQEGQERYKNSYEVLCNHTVNYGDLKPFQRSDIDWLIQRKILWIDECDHIAYSKKMLFVLHDLFNNEYLCLKYVDNFADEIKFLQENNLIRIASSFLSIPEQNYYNYIFNNVEYDNSEDLRNRYAHGNHTLNEDVMKRDYITMLRMMILIILKINEEFCLINDE